MADTIYYLGTEPDDFSVISAAFKQMAREVRLHFAAYREELMNRLNNETHPAVIFIGLSPDAAASVVRELKGHPAARWIPTILIGDHTYEAQGERLVSYGAVAYLQRPVQAEAIHRLFCATGELMFRPQEDGALLSLAAGTAPTENQHSASR